MSQRRRILILGKTGMLGHMVAKVFAQERSFTVIGTSLDKSDPLHFDALGREESINDLLSRVRASVVINCIGVLNSGIRNEDLSSVARAIKVNGLFPFRLALAGQQIGTQIIQISTDGVFRGTSEAIYEDSPTDGQDIYAKTKCLGEVNALNFLSVRCSILGPSPYEKGGLYEWVLSQNKNAALPGFTNHHWNGVTTLQLSRFCLKVIYSGLFEKIRAESPVVHLCPNAPVTKYELLVLLTRLLRKDLKIMRARSENGPVSRILDSRLACMKSLYPKKEPFEKALEELVNFCKK